MQRFRICPRRSSARSGFTLFEIFVAVIVFGSVLATFVPLMQSVNQQQLAADQQLLALREADNLLEEIAQRPWKELTTDALSGLTLSDAAKSQLPKSELRAEIQDQPGPPITKRTSVEVIWPPHT